MRKAYYILGFIAAFCISFGALFKLMHWPFASILSITGFLFLCFGFLPVYFIKNYKDRDKE